MAVSVYTDYLSIDVSTFMRNEHKCLTYDEGLKKDLLNYLIISIPSTGYYIAQCNWHNPCDIGHQRRVTQVTDLTNAHTLRINL